MDKKRKEYIDSLWMDSKVGRWAKFLSEGNKDAANKITRKLFDEGHLDHNRYLIEEEKQLCQKVKFELRDAEEGKEYILELEKNNYNLVGVMVAYDFTLLDLYYESE